MNEGCPLLNGDGRDTRPGIGEILDAILLEATRPVSLIIHLADEEIGDIRLQGVHTEDERERVAEELDEALPSDPHVAYPRHTSRP